MRKIRERQINLYYGYVFKILRNPTLPLILLSIFPSLLKVKKIKNPPFVPLCLCGSFLIFFSKNSDIKNIYKP
jgi:hypothetical protein